MRLRGEPEKIKSRIAEGALDVSLTHNGRKDFLCKLSMKPSTK